MKKKFILLVISTFLISACNGQDEDKNLKKQDSEKNEETKDEIEEEVEEENKITLSDIEVAPIDKLVDDEVVTIDHNILPHNDIGKSDGMHIFYGDNDIIASVFDVGTFRYDLSTEEMIWVIPEMTTSFDVLDNSILYYSSLDNKKVNLTALSTKDGEIVQTYIHNEYEIASYPSVFDDYILFRADTIGEEYGRPESLLAFERDSGNFLWSTPTDGVTHSAVELEDSFLLYNEYVPEGDDYLFDDTAFVYDKETGEEKYTIVEDTIGKKPVFNDEGLYFLDYGESTISRYDFEGNLEIKEEMEVGFGAHQLIQPVVTDNSYIAANDEGIAWYETDLSGIQFQIGRGESTIRWMESTDKRLYAIISEDMEDDLELYSIVSIDIDTGEVYSKTEIAATEKNLLSHPHVSDNKFHFSFGKQEKEQWEHYIFSSDNVNKPFDE